MAGPAYYSATLNVAKNEDWVVAFQYATPNADGSLTPIDLTGSILKLEIRENESDHEAIVSVYSPDNGIGIISATGGGFVIVLLRDEHLIRLAPGSYVTDLVRLMPSGYQERIFEGTVSVVEGTTR